MWRGTGRLRTQMVTRFAVCVAAFLTLAGGCGGSGPSGPSGPVPVIDLTGTWIGPASDSSGPGTMTWVLTRTSSGASGQATATSPLGSVALTGSVSLELSGASATWRMDIPAGGVLGAPTCTVTVTGTATVTTAAISGRYTGTGSCTDPFADGTVSLEKQ